MIFNTKFDVGTKVWFMQNNKPVEAITSSIEISYIREDNKHIKYTARKVYNSISWLDYTNLFEDNLYSTKEELINSL